MRNALAVYCQYSCLCFVTLGFRLHSDSVRAEGHLKETKNVGIYFVLVRLFPSVQPVTLSYQIILCLSLVLESLKFRYLSRDLYNDHYVSQFLHEFLTEGTAITQKLVSSHCKFSMGHFNAYLTSRDPSCCTSKQSFWFQLLGIPSGFSKYSF